MYRINSKKDLKNYLAADARSLGVEKRSRFFQSNDILILQKRLRKLEFALNCSRNPVLKILRRYFYKRSSIRLGVSISPNTFGPGLSIAHRGNIVVNGGARIGANCRIHVGVNIGTEAGKDSDAPTIGDNCYLGPGAKLFGKIVIGPESVIGANAVVNKNFPGGYQTLGGIPAKVISSKSSEGLLIKGYKID